MMKILKKRKQLKNTIDWYNDRIKYRKMSIFNESKKYNNYMDNNDMYISNKSYYSGYSEAYKRAQECDKNVIEYKKNLYEYLIEVNCLIMRYNHLDSKIMKLDFRPIDAKNKYKTCVNKYMIPDLTNIVVSYIL